METDKLKILDQTLSDLISRFPQQLEPAIFKDKDRLLAYFDHEFLRKRSVKHLIRLLTAQYLKKKKLLGMIHLSPKNRSIELRIMPTKLEFPFTSKWVIGILVQLSLGGRYELFDQMQLLKAVQKIMPDLTIVKGSVYLFQGADDGMKTVYAEFERHGNHVFTLTEIKALKHSLENELLNSVERLVPTVFMTRNQEEVLRNILTLSQQIEHGSDLPQVMISYESQTTEELIFTVICVRPESLDAISIDTFLKQKSSFSQWILERKQLVKYLEQHQPICAYIFRVLLTPHPSILRNDGSLNFFAARQKIGSYLRLHIGEFRDFNGGILIKQEETLHSLKLALPHVPPERIEDAFYAISPIEMQAILPLSTLAVLIQLLMDAFELPLSNSSDYVFKSSVKDSLLLALVRIPNGTFYELARDHLLSIDLPDVKQASLSLAMNDSFVFGYLLETENIHLQERFLDSLEKLLAYWGSEVKKQQVLCLSLENTIFSLDPRIGGDSISACFLKMLFEGLMRIGSDGTLEKGIAEHIDISPDRKTYLFTLRSSFWSDGSPLTSYDFEYTWKKTLTPRFNTAFAYLLYQIKNAELAKKGMVDMSQVGVHALGDRLLKVELEYPSSSFLEFTAHPLFAPICKQVDINAPNWPQEEGPRYVCNGGFKIEKNQKDSRYVLIKNGHYWNKEKIYLERVLIASSHHTQSYEMFNQNKIHWLGAPWGTWEKHFKPGSHDEALTFPDQGVYWCICNTKHPFLKNRKIRQALSLAIDRLKLLETIEYFKKPAYSPLPASHSQIDKHPLFETENEKTLFKEGLEESGYSTSTIPHLTIDFTQRTIFGKPSVDFISSQWKKKLGLSTTIQGHDYKMLLSNIVSGDFQVALIRWQPWVNDPFYTLNCFANPNEPMNLSKWSHPEVQKLLHESQLETNDEKRKSLLYQVEELLIREMPIIPLFESCYQFMKKKNLVFTPNHTLMDFKWARLER
ncbi:MAG TPA: peptide ABC transporter substrate-binding protein [Rhabdochlamydiaceae bacterium]|jgi:oligopeptide transport system substrate-binding protein|nr:peptide ABC transporter substrate-binding protein [Rhabdochlamydiaceae bacterium]